ncbi:Elongation of very long chain fatty acids protein 1 [Portunus trituberculatus]|uniref:Elongation of very long chain fatty acids protein n=1 Tax=Portunus trituberculatus TaxID=210409 RepID=A0A5B7GDD2_PORTR|nr:Elongation of very long chain fatty acids protein 1 [Portunus trituberculatus]
MVRRCPNIKVLSDDAPTYWLILLTFLLPQAGIAGWFGSYSFICQPCDFSNSPSALKMLRAAISYHASKFLDFFDTIFFVLNHKYSHVSLLHVAHHALMPVGLWYGVRHEPGKFCFMLCRHDKISFNRFL